MANHYICYTLNPSISASCPSLTAVWGQKFTFSCTNQQHELVSASLNTHKFLAIQLYTAGLSNGCAARLWVKQELYEIKHQAKQTIYFQLLHEA